VHLSAADAPPADEAGLKAALDGCGATYTVMRTGAFAKSGSGGGLVVGELDAPTCDEINIDDAFRFLVEALSLPEADGRLISLCPSTDGSQLKQMRMAGCTRAEEVVALLKGIIVVKAPGEAEADAGATAEAAAKDDDPRSEEEKAAAAAEELKMLLERARVKGIENQKKMKEEEEAKAAKRAERKAYFAMNEPKDDDEGEGGDKKGSDGDDPPPKKPDGDGDGGGGGGGGDKPKKDGGDDDDGLALV